MAAPAQPRTPPSRSLTARGALALLALLSCLTMGARGWSGADAYTIVLLDAVDTDPVLHKDFYDAPNGSLFTVVRGGYRLMDDDIDAVSAQRGAEVSATLSHYAVDERVSTGMAYRGAHVMDAPLPFRCRLSGEWVLWSKERPRRAGVAAPAEPILLHCRLPLPQNRTEQAQLRRRYIADHHTAMADALERWWHTAVSATSAWCLYGDGEKSLTGVERYYELCPAGVVYRVQHERLKHLLQPPASGHGGSDGASAESAPAEPSVIDFLHAMHSSPSSRNAVLQNPRYAGVFERIGGYHPRLSKPRWNSEYLAWESWYPSTSPCTTHYTTLAEMLETGAQRPNHTHRAVPPARSVRPDDAFWKTVVRFRCPSHRSPKETHKMSMWTVTEARQLCEYNVEVMSELVCGWEQELDSFQVNPVPCVVVD